MSRPVIIGAVMYDPKVSVIWEIIGDFFESKGCPIDVTFYSNYDLLVSALVAGSVEIGWLSPLAWLDTERRSEGRCRAIAMRDTDRNHSPRFQEQSASLPKVRDCTQCFLPYHQNVHAWLE